MQYNKYSNEIKKTRSLESTFGRNADNAEIPVDIIANIPQDTFDSIGKNFS